VRALIEGKGREFFINYLLSMMRCCCVYTP